MPSNDLAHGPVAGPAVAVGTGFALLTLVTHAANFAFVAAAGRLLGGGDFADLVALLGIVLIGLAPGMAVQALTAAGVLGRPALVDRDLGRRLGLLITGVVGVATLGAWVLLDLRTPLVLVGVPLAAGLLPLTAVNEGLLQGHRRFLVLGCVMAGGALVKLGLGLLAMVVAGSVGWAMAAVAAGYASQTTLSRLATADRRPVRDDGHGLQEVAYAVAVLGSLLVLVHLDAVLAPALLDDAAAGQYGVGATAARMTFWLPQFAVLLWFPRMVRRRGTRALLVGVGGVVALGVAGGLAAVVLGGPLARLVFGADLGAIGDELWRWVWIGTTSLVLQVLTLSDLATGGRRSWALLAPALVGVAVALPAADPTTASDAVTVAAAVCSVVAVAGVGRALITR